MIAASLLPATDRLPRHSVRRLYESCLADYEFLRTFNDETLTLSEEPAEVARAGELKAAWVRWADGAEAALRRMDHAPDVGEQDRADLARRIRFARHLVKRDPAEMRRLDAKAAAGGYITREEARRAMGLSDRS